MIDLLRTKVKLNCPECTFENEVSLGQVAKEEEIICTGCLKSITLVDDNKSVRKANEDISDSLNKLKRAFKKFK